jgi:hypothetical protein
MGVVVFYDIFNKPSNVHNPIQPNQPLTNPQKTTPSVLPEGVYAAANL